MEGWREREREEGGLWREPSVASFRLAEGRDDDGNDDLFFFSPVLFFFHLFPRETNPEQS